MEELYTLEDTARLVYQRLGIEVSRDDLSRFTETAGSKEAPLAVGTTGDLSGYAQYNPKISNGLTYVAFSHNGRTVERAYTNGNEDGVREQIVAETLHALIEAIETDSHEANTNIKAVNYG